VTTIANQAPKRKRIAYAMANLAAIAAAMFALAACSKKTRHVTVEDLQKSGEVKIGFANESPYAYVDNETGRLTGEAPEIARAVMEKLGVDDVDGVLTEFGSLVPGLEAGRFDLIAAGMYVTPERCKRVAFSEPTYCIPEAFAVAAGNPLGLHSYEDVANNGSAKLGVVRGTVEHGYAEAMGVPSSRIVIFPDAPSALAGVQADRVDAYAGTSLTIDDLLGKADDADLERAAPFRGPVVDGKPAMGCGAFALRKGDTELLAAINAELDALIGSDEHLALVAPFGFSRDTVPADITTAQLCAP